MHIINVWMMTAAYSSCSQVEDSRSDTGTLAQSTNLWQALFALCLQPCFQAA